MAPRSWSAPRRGRVALRLLLASVVVLTGIGTTRPAAAHAGLIATTPIPDQVLTAPPSEVRLTFTEEVEPGIGGIQVLDPDGGRVDVGTVNRSQDGLTLIVPIDTAATGTHTVAWRVVSSDGHTINGSWVFHVGRRTGGASVADDSDAPTSIVEWLGRAAAFGGLVLLLGALWMGGPRGLPSLERLQRGAALSMVAGSVVLLWARGAEAGGRPLWRAAPSVGRLVTDTWAGGVDAARIGLAVLALALVLRRAWLPAIGAAFAVMTTFPLAGHAWTTEPVALSVLVDATHLAAVSVWAGGVVALLVAIGAPDAEPAWAAGMVRQASKGFTVAAPLVVVTGVVSTIVHISGPGDIPASGWGRALLVKVGLALAALGLGWTHRRRLAAAVAEGVGRLATLRLEAGVLVAAVAATAVLVTLPPAEVALDRPYSATRTTPAGAVQLDVTPARGGINDIHLAFRRGTADRPVDAVQVRISTEGVPPRTVTMQLDGASHAYATGVSFGPPGTWRVAVTTVYRGTPDTTTFEVELR